MGIRLNDDQIKQIAGFTSNFSLVFFAAIFTPIFSGIENIGLFNVILGLVVGLTSLVLSLWLIRSKKR